MWLTRRKKTEEDPNGYKVDTLGPLIIERIQMPHSYHKENGDEFNILTWDYYYRLADGPVFIRRMYVKGTPEAIREFKLIGMLRDSINVDSEYDARIMFYRLLHFKLGE